MTSKTTPSSTTTTSSIRPRKVLVPKVWKRPHSTIYGKNVEFGSSLYSDKIGEINGRKFNSELPWSVRNSGGSLAGSSQSSGITQGYLSNSTCRLEPISDSGDSFARLLELSRPQRRGRGKASEGASKSEGRGKRIDFYEQFGDFVNEIERVNQASRLYNEPLLFRSAFDNFLDFDSQLGLFLPAYENLKRVDNYDRSSSSCSGLQSTLNRSDINTKPFVPITTTTTTQPTPLLPKHHCQLTGSPYGQSADGRKLSLGSINPHSYRPSLPNKTTTTHSSDGEEFEFQDRSSPFYTDRWAGKTIRHFDSDLYSNANLFKSMIL